MIFKAARCLTAAVLLGFSLVSAQNDTNGFSCGSTPDRDRIAAVQEQLEGLPTLWPRRIAARGPFTVPVVWNVIYDPNNNEGNLPDQIIQTQMAVINQYFNQIGLGFGLQAIKRTPNRVWFRGGGLSSGYTRQMKDALYIGDAKTLNFYSIGRFQDGFAGFATFPWDYGTAPRLDGVVMDYNYLPLGQHVDYNTGKIGVHEVGHWLGLLHTFEGGCNGGGDYVDDTPAEASSASGCPAGRDTCAAPGRDPIENMMDYSNDPCRRQFTNGQYNRIAKAISQYRGINL
ncbi:extracellular metalloprotease [Ceratobasidium sp. AG-Ba]|nr:extracellular metalloprotease [Ceratobasidium sp. AG-Ba]